MKLYKGFFCTYQCRISFDHLLWSIFQSEDTQNELLYKLRIQLVFGVGSTQALVEICNTQSMVERNYTCWQINSLVGIISAPNRIQTWDLRGTDSLLEFEILDHSTTTAGCFDSDYHLNPGHKHIRNSDGSHFCVSVILILTEVLK